MTESSTTILRRLLDERGVEHYDHENDEPLRDLSEAGPDPATSWRMGDASVCAVPNNRGTFDIWIDHATPEQAIAATLVTETCHDKNGFDVTFGFECTVCGAMTDGYMLTTADMGHYKQFNFCPMCGRRVEQ